MGDQLKPIAASASVSSSQTGQMTIEAILMAIILTSVAMALSRTARESGFVASLVEGPWKPIQGMIEDGVWVRAGASKAYNPHLKDRHGSFEGLQD